MRLGSVIRLHLPSCAVQSNRCCGGISLGRGFQLRRAPMTGTGTIEVSEDQATLDVDDVRAAAERIVGAVVRTPTMHSKTLSKITGAEIWLKFENQQFTAAYKERGALNALLMMHDDHISIVNQRVNHRIALDLQGIDPVRLPQNIAG